MSSTPSTDSLPSLSATSVLVVDDQPTAAELLGQTLQMAGYPVCVCTRPEDALEAVKHRRFAVVLTDQRMPGMTGLELLDAIKRVQPEATRVLITGVPDLRTVIEAINRGEIYRFVAKPWLREELLATVANAVQRHRFFVESEQKHREALETNARLRDELAACNAELARAEQRLSRWQAWNEQLEAHLQQTLQWPQTLLHLFLPELAHRVGLVQRLCLAMAQTLDLPPAQRRDLFLAAGWHEVGLLALSRSVLRRWLNNPTSLSAEDQKRFRQHPLEGERLLRRHKAWHGAAAIVRSHHERWDGAGYPDGRAGEDIPWLARLLGAAVYFVELPCSGADAVEALQGAVGQALDPLAVRVLTQALPRCALAAGPTRDSPGASWFDDGTHQQGIYAPNGKVVAPPEESPWDDYLHQLQAELSSEFDGTELSLRC